MKRVLSILVGVGFATGISTSAFAIDLLDSPHDLSATSTANIHTTGVATGTAPNDEICVFCHTPHGGIDIGSLTTAGGGALLWNRSYDPTTVDGTNTWQFYASPTLEANTAAITSYNSLGSQTLACLSCHDGSIALDSLINFPGHGFQPLTVYTFQDTETNLLTGTNELRQATDAGIAPASGLGRNLSNDHPVGMDISQVYLTDTGIRDAAPAIAYATTLGSAGAPKFFGTGGVNKVECASCHNPHDWDGLSVGTNLPSGRLFLRVEMIESKLCRTCHVK